MALDLFNMFLDWTVMPAALTLLATIFPTVCFMRFLYWLFNRLFPEDIYNKVVLITGASSGIGETTAYEYAKRGAKLVLVARREGRLKQVATKARRHGAMDVRIIPADLIKVDDCRRIVEETIRLYGRLDHLVNNVGMANAFFFDQAKPEGLPPSFNVTFWGSVYPTYYALPHLRQSGGRIVVIASVAGFVPLPRMSMYNAAKAALIQLYETLRVELGRAVGITIVTPGWIESQMTKGKFINADGEGKMQDTYTRDMQVGLAPVAYTEVAAKAIVNGALHRKWYVCVPYWYQTFIYFRIFMPEVLEGFLRLFFVQPLIQKKPPSKLAIDVLGAKKVLYPPSIQTDQRHPTPVKSH